MAICARLLAGTTLLLVILAVPVQPIAAADDEKHENLRALLQTTGAMSNVRRVIDLTLPRLIATFKKINPNIPQNVWDEMQRVGGEEFRKSIPDLEEPLIAIYDANFSAEEVKQLLAFYRGPLGQKVITKVPEIMQQGLALGRVWGQQVGERAAARMRETAKQKGYDL